MLYVTLLLLFLSWSSSSWAAPCSPTTFYVSQGGSNANSCCTAQSASTTLRTINAGIACMTAGDTLLIRGGTYNEQLSAPDGTNFPSGTSWNNPVRIAGYPSEVVTLRPSAATNVHALVNIGDTGGTTQYIILDNLVIDAINFSQSASNHPVRLGTGANFIRIQNSTLKNGLSISGGLSGNNGLLLGGTGNEFINLEITNNAGYGIYMTGSNHLVSDCRIHDNHGFGIHHYADGGGVDNNTIRNNTIYNNGVKTDTCWGGCYHPGMIVASGSGSQVYNNVLYNNAGGGIVVNYGEANSGVWNNTIYGNHRAPCLMYYNTDGPNNKIQNNICYGNTLDGGSDSLDIQNASGLTQSNNLFSDPGFANAPAADFHLTVGSPAIGTGVTIPSVPTDQAGATRVAPYDLGIYVFAVSLPPPGVLARWPLDEGTGTSATDVIGGHTGELVGTPTWSPGRIGPRSLVLDGLTQAVSVPSTSDLQLSSAMTVSAWIKPTSAGGGARGRILNKHGLGSSVTGYSFNLADNALVLGINTLGVTGEDVAQSVPTVVFGVWQHVAATLNAGLVTFYRNGQVVAPAAGNGTITQTAQPNDTPLVIGGADGRTDRNFDGGIDDPRLANYALTSAEILALYRSTAGQPRHRMVLR